MIRAHTILPLILGLVVASPWQNVQGDTFFNNLKVKNSTYAKPGNKTHHDLAVMPAVVNSGLYTKFVCQGKQNGLRLPIEGSCTQYLECQQGSAKLMSCKVGKHFSTFGLACIDVKLSKCSVKCECCGKDDGLYPDFTNCANFVVCLKGKAHRESCGSILKFNSKKLMCDIPQRTRCSETSNNTSIDRKIEVDSNILKTPMFMISHRICRNESNGYTVGVAGSCNKFYLCVNGIGYLKSCGHLQFNAEGHYCDIRTRIYCSEFEENEIVLESDEIPKPWLRPQTPAPQIPQNPENIDELQPPHRIPGKPFPQELLPNDNALHPPNVGQEEHPLWENNTPPMPPLPEDYQKPGNFPYHPPNQGSHAIPKPPVIVVEPVPIPPTIVVEVIDPTEYSGLCTDQSVGALIAMPKHCNKYIRCKWHWYERRIAEVESCPKDKHFNAKSKICDVPEKAGCIIHLKN